MWNYDSIPQYVFMAWYLSNGLIFMAWYLFKHRNSLTLNLISYLLIFKQGSYLTNETVHAAFFHLRHSALSTLQSCDHMVQKTVHPLS
jgi:hypothetical protein